MNKLVKGSIAGAAGIALLLGGAGTLAYWNDASTVDAGTITAGTLTIDATGSGEWTEDGSTIANIDNYKIIPGATLVYTHSFNVTATGDNLVADLELSSDSIQAASTDAADVALANLLTSTASFTVDGATATQVVAAAGVQVVEISVSVTFPDGGEPADSASGDNAAKTGSVDLSELEILVKQVV